jgi:hypothetical protein
MQHRYRHGLEITQVTINNVAAHGLSMAKDAGDMSRGMADEVDDRLDELLDPRRRKQDPEEDLFGS